MVNSRAFNQAWALRRVAGPACPFRQECSFPTCVSTCITGIPVFTTRKCRVHHLSNSAPSKSLYQESFIFFLSISTSPAWHQPYVLSPQQSLGWFISTISCYKSSQIQHIGLAKKFIQVFLYDIMENLLVNSIFPQIYSSSQAVQSHSHLSRKMAEQVPWNSEWIRPSGTCILLVGEGTCVCVVFSRAQIIMTQWVSEIRSISRITESTCPETHQIIQFSSYIH